MYRLRGRYSFICSCLNLVFLGGCLGKNLKLSESIHKYSSIEGILYTTSIYELPGLHQSSQLFINFGSTASIWKTFKPIYFCIGIDFGTKVSSFFFVLDLVIFLLMQSYIEWQKYWLKNKKRNISKFVTNIQNVGTNNIRANSNQISINFINTDNNQVVSNNTQPNNIEDSSSKKDVENDLIFGNRFKFFFIPNTQLVL
jgi:hypothetical protein